MTAPAAIVSLKQRLHAGAPLLGTWIKTPSAIIVEVLGLSGLGVLCLDAEHAPFDRGDLDACLLAGRASGMPMLVRIPSSEPMHLLNALDLGADGVVVPHVRSVDDAEAAVRLAHFGRGGRGFAGSTRAAGYTTRGMAEHLERSRAATVVVAQIEDAEAIDAIDGIAAVPGIDCLFVGRADLAVSLGANSASDSILIEASHAIVTAARRHGRPTGMFVSDLAELPAWIEAGVSLFLLESDHTFLLKGARSLSDRFHAARL